jgi:hypothetical protein
MIRHVSTRFNIEDVDPEERRNLLIKELGRPWGQAWSALKKSWQRFYAARRQGDSETVDMLLERISTIRKFMGLEDDGSYF